MTLVVAELIVDGPRMLWLNLVVAYDKIIPSSKKSVMGVKIKVQVKRHAELYSHIPVLDVASI